MKYLRNLISSKHTEKNTEKDKNERSARVAKKENEITVLGM